MERFTLSWQRRWHGIDNMTMLNVTWLCPVSSQLWSFSHSDSTVTRHHSSAAQNLSRLCKLGAIENKLHQYYISSTVLQLVLRVTNVCLLSLEKNCLLFIFPTTAKQQNSYVLFYHKRFSKVLWLTNATYCTRMRKVVTVRILKDAGLNNNK